MFHLMTVHGANGTKISFETDRMRFIGRGGSAVAPRAMLDPGSLSNTAGSVLDPVAAIRHQMIIDGGATVTIDMVSGASETRDGLLRLVDKYQDRRLVDRVFELTWTHSQVVLQQLNATEADSQLYGRLASSVIYANASLRAAAGVLVRNRRGQSGLWGHAISGDLPIVLLQISAAGNIDLVRQLVQAHAYWRLKGLSVDLVIWNEDHDVYRQRLQEQILGLIAAGVEARFVDRPGGIFVRHAEQISSEDRILFESVARAIIVDSRGTLADQINRRVPAEVRIPRLAPTHAYRPQGSGEVATQRDDLILFNGIGGFSPDGREYLIAPGAGKTTPTPWANVIANSRFGTVVSESGLGYTWSENAHLFRLTPWHNDPVSDPSGEAIYLRDEETGHFWSATSLPCPGSGPYVTRHGFGYSVFEHTEDGIRSEHTVFVALDAAVKLFSLKVHNDSGRMRQISVVGYVEWVLGDVRAKSAMHVSTQVDARNGAFYVRNAYNSEFSDNVAFFDVDEPTRTVTGSRAEFLGRNGTLRDPAALHRVRLSGKTGAGLTRARDAGHVPTWLTDSNARRFQARRGKQRRCNQHAGAALPADPQPPQMRSPALSEHWRHTLTAVQIDTPDIALNVLTNGLVDVPNDRVPTLGTQRFYQSGGAYGFPTSYRTPWRWCTPNRGCCAIRSRFVRVDNSSKATSSTGGIRDQAGAGTHCSDDYLWLPLATSRYILARATWSILDETDALPGRTAGECGGRLVLRPRPAGPTGARRS
jgi:cellobiose phosphorylase